MSSYWRKLSALSSGLTAFCVAVAIAFENRLVESLWVFIPLAVVTVAVALIFSHYGPEVLLSSLFRFERVRRYLLGEAWIEGYWGTLTTHKNGSQAVGIVQVKYIREGTNLTLRITGWQKAGPAIIESHSENALVEGNTFINHFKTTMNHIRTTEMRPRTGISVGKLTLTLDAHPHPNRFKGDRFYFADDQATEAYQEAVKLDFKLVAEWQKLGVNWIESLLDQDADLRKFLSNSASARIANADHQGH